jgi:hypothetical protein
VVAAGKGSSWWRKLLRKEAEPPAEDPAALRLRTALAAVRAGFPVAPAAHPVGFSCSCERVGCPAPAQHPVSFTWQAQATTDVDQVTRWLARDPEANFVTPTGRVHDVLDVPAEAGRLALDRLGEKAGPVAAVGEDRYLFFTTTRSPLDEDEWWTSELDAFPEDVAEHPGLRWHTRGSYVLLPPSQLTDGGGVRWVRGPEHGLPDPLRLLDVLTDACAEVGAAPVPEQWLIG